jgi:hypothetical protein
MEDRRRRMTISFPLHNENIDSTFLWPLAHRRAVQIFCDHLHIVALCKFVVMLN